MRPAASACSSSTLRSVSVLQEVDDVESCDEGVRELDEHAGQSLFPAHGTLFPDARSCPVIGCSLFMMIVFGREA
jgi:hypothetical protein